MAIMLFGFPTRLYTTVALAEALSGRIFEHAEREADTMRKHRCRIGKVTYK